MPSKPVIRRQRIDNALRSSLTRHQEALLEGLRERLGPLLGEGEVLESYDTLHHFFLELLDAREKSLVEADEAHLAELMDDRAERRFRDQARSEVRDVLIGIRNAANGHFGRDQAAEFLNLEGLTSRDPVALYRQGTRVMERLRDASLRMPSNHLSGEEPNRQGWAARLEPALTKLKEAIETVGDESREASLTRASKEAAVKAHDQDIGALSRILQGFLILGDRKDLADDVRPARLRRRARAAAEAEQEGGEEAPDTEDSSQPDTSEDGLAA